MSLAIGSEATFVARTHDMDRKHMQKMFKRAYEHPGASLVEVFQNCNVFNDGAFDQVSKRDNRSAMLIRPRTRSTHSFRCRQRARRGT